MRWQENLYHSVAGRKVPHFEFTQVIGGRRGVALSVKQQRDHAGAGSSSIVRQLSQQIIALAPGA